MGFYLPAWCSTADYIKLKLLESRSLKVRWKTIRGALVMSLMIEGFQKGVIKFSIITCRKSE
ncbi:putative tocopherol C-methyltransferase [Helianthus debilis subsp. tardiflorus]